MIGKMFERAREQSDALAPSFRRTWSAAERRARAGAGPRSRRWWLSMRMGPWAVLTPAAAAGVLALAAFLLVASPRDRLSSQERRMIAELSDWNAPTDVLLDDYGLGLPAGTPELGRSLDRLNDELMRTEPGRTR